MTSISFKNNGTNAGLENKPELRKFLSSIFKNEGVVFKNVSFIFSTDEAVLQLNREFLDHDTLTDILTFTLSNTDEAVASEIYISVERVRENAKNFKVPYMNELYRVMIHGILHLCGFSDHNTKLKSTMRKREDFYLEQVRFT